MHKNVDTIRLNLSLCVSHLIGGLVLVAFVSSLIEVSYSRVLHNTCNKLDECYLMDQDRSAICTLSSVLCHLHSTLRTPHSSATLRWILKALSSAATCICNFLFTVTDRKLLGSRPDPDADGRAVNRMETQMELGPSTECQFREPPVSCHSCSSLPPAAGCLAYWLLYFKCSHFTS